MKKLIKKKIPPKTTIKYNKFVKHKEVNLYIYIYYKHKIIKHQRKTKDRQINQKNQN